jgi:hypothetical protein
MYELQIFFQRRRKMLTRIGALIALGVGGLLAVLPRADAHDAQVQAVAEMGGPSSFLLSPERMSGERFAAFYALVHR